MTETATIIVAEQIRRKDAEALKAKNKEIPTFVIKSKNQLTISTNTPFDLSPLFEVNLNNCDLLSELNPEIQFELYHGLLSIKSMSSISDMISGQICGQLNLPNENGIALPPYRGVMGTGQAEFLVPPSFFQSRCLVDAKCIT